MISVVTSNVFALSTVLKCSFVHWPLCDDFQPRFLLKLRYVSWLRNVVRLQTCTPIERHVSWSVHGTDMKFHFVIL